MLTWSEFERIFKKKYLLERYYDDRENDFCEIKMGLMTGKEHNNIFPELLR